MLKNFLLFTIAFFIGTAGAQAKREEPAYCNPATFKNYEVAAPISGLKKAHIYKLGNATIIGLAVGNTDVQLTQQVAQHYSSTSASEGYCTWYLNRGEEEAEQSFVHEYLSHPGSNAEQYAQEYITKMAPHIDQNAVSFVSCIEDRGYIAMGCNGMKHRGPSVFGMLLSYSGCSPANANKIVNQVWGLNGVPEEVRLAIIRKANELGIAHPDLSQRIRNQFLGISH